MTLGKNNEVVVEHEFAAPPAKVFEALKAGRLFFNCGAWADGSEIDFRVGGKYRFNWEHHGTTYGEFTEIIENKRLAFTWLFDEMEVNSRVTIDLVAQGSGCKVKLKHEGFQSKELAEMHNGGWTEGLTGFSNELVRHRVRLEREFLVPVELLYEACSGMKFFSHLGATAANAKIDFRVGGEYRAKLENGNEIHGKFTEIAKNKKIAFTWESAPCGTPLEKTTIVTMEFGPWGDDGKNSYLELIHEGFMNTEATRAHHEGWNKILRQVYRQTSR